jgi:acetyl-CoA acetyltransferase
MVSKGLATLRDLGVTADDLSVNRNGGSIAPGHPLRMSCGGITGTAARDAPLRKGRVPADRSAVGTFVRTVNWPLGSDANCSRAGARVERGSGSKLSDAGPSRL